MAQVVRSLGRGGQRWAEAHLGWCRATIRKGLSELACGTSIRDRFHERGRKRIEEHLPNLLEDIRLILEPTGQVDPTFRSTRLYSPLDADEVRNRLIRDKGYKDSELPTARTIRNKLNQLNYRPSKVAKCLPLKKIPETDAIFEQVHQVNQDADREEGVLRISIDTKAILKIGPFSRGGCSRQGNKAWDHDFQPSAKLTPFGILLPHSGANHLWFAESKVTADFMADRLDEMIPRWKEEGALHTLVINADNGPESNGRRKQWLKRIVELADRHEIHIRLAYYPPYHSKYNPVERLWGILENHWRGEIIDSIGKALGLARTMTYRGIKPTVRQVKKHYSKGVSVAKREMEAIEARLTRTEGLEDWFIDIAPEPRLG
jgi:hypothetical protein